MTSHLVAQLSYKTEQFVLWQIKKSATLKIGVWFFVKYGQHVVENNSLFSKFVYEITEKKACSIAC